MMAATVISFGRTRSTASSITAMMRTRRHQSPRKLSHGNEFQFNRVALLLADLNTNFLGFGNSERQSGSDITP